MADCGTIYATTARPREMTKRVLTPEAAMAEARGITAGGGRVAVLFGPERAGLANEDVVLADTIVSVPVNPAFGSLNLAQCVLLTAYEWRRQGDAPAADGGRARARRQRRCRAPARPPEAELDAAGFFYPAHKRPAMLANLHNLFRRAPLTDAGVRTLRGVVRALAEGPRRRR